MYRKLVSIITALIMTNVVFMGLLASIDGKEYYGALEMVSGYDIYFSGGDGSVNNPYKITNITELQWIENSSNLDKHFILMNDINASLTKNWNGGEGFDPIGSWSSRFTGSLNGNGKSINGFFLNDSTNINGGIFSFIGSEGSVKNLTIIYPEYKWSGKLGSIAGNNYGTISNCHFTGNISYVRNTAGGIAGYNEGTIENCTANITIRTGRDQIGGLVGNNKGDILGSKVFVNMSEGGGNSGGFVGICSGGTIRNCSINGIVNRSGDYVGGFAGKNSGKILHSSFNGTVYGWKYAGGFIGKNEPGGSLSYCHSAATVTGRDEYTGGLIGFNEATLSNCSSNGSVTNGARFLGGLIGENRNDIEYCHSEVNVSGKNAFTGGLIGLNDAGKVIGCYSLGDVTGGFNTGGLIGENRGTVINSYYSINGTKINGMNMVTTYGIYIGQFLDWMVDRSISIDDYFTMDPVTRQYKVSNLSDLQNILAFYNGAYKFRQTGDIDLSPLPNFYIPVFKSEEFDGSNYEIRSLNLTMKKFKYLGLFGITGTNTRLSDINLVNCTITGNNYLGGLVGRNHGTIDGCTVDSHVDGKQYLGGLVGRNDGPLRNTGVSSTVNGTEYIGGLCGYNFQSDIFNCSSSGKTSGSLRIGGLIGNNEGNSATINGSYSICDIIITSGDYTQTGGFIGSSSGSEIINCFSGGSIRGRSWYVGGFIGRSSDTNISYSYSTVDINTTAEYIGGFIGYSNPDVYQCYYAGKMKANGPTKGGLIGRQGYSGSVTASFWDEELSGMTSSDGGIGRNTAMMKKKSTFINSGWNFNTDWFMKENETYPLLKNLDYGIPILKDDMTPGEVEPNSVIDFNISVQSILPISTVEVEYWMGSGEHLKTELLGNNPYSKEITVSGDPLTPLSYRFIASDIAGKTARSKIENVEFFDLNKPVFEMDLSPESGHTGNNFGFEILVDDDVGIENVSTEYWFGSGPRFNESMVFDSGSYTFDLMIPADSLDQLHYIFHAVDTSGNWNRTDQVDVSILDDDLPVFGPDESDVICTTGEQYGFGIWADDNIDIDEVKVEYWFGEGPRNNVSMNDGGPYSYTVDIPSDSSETLHYIFHASDTSGNWNHTPQVDVEILDNDLPVFMEDLSDTTATTGDNFSFEVEVSDNIGISVVYVEYWFGTGDHTNESMDPDESFGLKIEIPSDSLEKLNYIFHAVDESGNWAHTDLVDISIADNDLPEVIADESPDEAFTGGDVEITIQATDNIGLAEVELIWMIGSDQDEQKDDMNLRSGKYVHTISVPLDSVDPLRYVIRIIDTSGNIFESDEATITITDSISPTVDPVDDITIYEGQEVDVTITATDNIGIISYSWDGAPIDADGSELKGTVTVPGDYEITVTVSDEEGNTNSTSFKVTVLPENYDTDSDGIPDLVEIEWGLSIDDPSDGEEDADNDGMSNSEEYEEGTLPFDDDTDDDGMPDGWEYRYGLDPKTASADNDEDGDGKTDLEEYQEGTDPIIKEKQEDDDGGFPLVLIIIIAVVILVVIGIVVFLLTRKKEEKLENDPDEEGNLPENEEEIQNKDENDEF